MENLSSVIMGEVTAFYSIPKLKPVHKARISWLRGRSDALTKNPEMPTTGIYGKSPKPSLEDPKPFTVVTLPGKGNAQNSPVLLDTGS